METSNSKIAKLLRNVAASYSIKKTGNIFQVRAYDNAADSIEHSTVEMKDLWEEGRLNEVPGLGETIRGYLDELFTKGKVSHFEEVQKDIPKIIFDLLDIPGIGPKTACKLSDLGINSLDDLKKQIKSGELVKKDFSAKIAQSIMAGLRQTTSKTGRMLLPYAFAQAEKILEYIKRSPSVKDAHFLGSLRRMVATIGDLDFSACSKFPKDVIEHFIKMPGVVRVVDKGESMATVMLQSGLHLDLLIGSPESYGALLQHFTGSKNHNIHLRTYALSKNLSLSEDGVKHTKTGKVVPTKTEEEFYKLLKMDIPAPEIREDGGEIEAGLAHKLPNLVETKDIKGELHTHSNYPFLHPSHGPGVNSMNDIVKKAISLRYSFIGISDHPPGHGAVSREKMIEEVKKRTKVVQSLKKSTKDVRILNGLEIDILPDGTLSVPDEALSTLDYVIAGIHSGHRGEKDIITKRLISALNNPHVDIISHPTNRLLNERESSDADWDEVFKVAVKNNKLLEINAFPNRLDLRDDLVREALKYGVKFIIDTDAHQVSQMDNMRFGVSVARRGWAEKKDIVNSWDWKKFSEWFTIKP